MPNVIDLPTAVPSTRTAAEHRSDHEVIHTALRALSASSPAVAAPGFDIWLLLGQSQWAGAAGFDARFDPSSERVWTFDGAGANKDVVRVATHPLNGHSTFSSNVTPGLDLGRRLLRHVPQQRSVLLVPCGEGGTTLVDDPARETWAPTSGLTVFAIAQARKALAAAGPGARIAGVVWIQGEADAGYPGAPATYAARLDALVDHYRAQLDPGLLWIVCQNSPDGQAAADVSVYADLVTIENAGRALPGRRKGTAWVQGVLGGTVSDSVHYAAPALRRVGELAGDGYPLALANTGPTPQVFPARPATPTGLAVNAATATATWNPVAGATGYIASWLPATGQTSRSSKAVQGQAAASLVLPLPVGNACAVRISAYGPGGMSAASATVSVTATGSGGGGVSAPVVLAQDNHNRADGLIGAGQVGPAPALATGQGRIVGNVADAGGAERALYPTGEPSTDSRVKVRYVKAGNSFDAIVLGDGTGWHPDGTVEGITGGTITNGPTYVVGDVVELEAIQPRTSANPATVAEMVLYKNGTQVARYGAPFNGGPFNPGWQGQNGTQWDDLLITKPGA